MWWLALRPRGSLAAVPAQAATDASASVAALQQQALAWWALRFTPFVARVDEAVVLDVSASERLFGGRQALMQALAALPPELREMGEVALTGGPSSLVALALAREGREHPYTDKVLSGLSLASLTAAQAHLPVLHRLGCQTWGDLQALPRGGVMRRFGQGLLDALDVANGHAPDLYPWVQLPAEFDLPLELPSLVESAPGLMFVAHRMLMQLRLWLQARQRAVLAIEWVWRLDERRLAQARAVTPLPDHETLVLRTATPSIDMAHLAKLTHEHLAKVILRAPVYHLRLRTLEITALPNASASLLPEDLKKGDSLAHLVERLSARLGSEQVVMPNQHQDHRPELMQGWQSPGAADLRRADNFAATALARAQTKAKAALGAPPRSKRLATRRTNGTSRANSASNTGKSTDPLTGTPIVSLYDASLSPTWLLPQPLLLSLVGHRPHYQGPLRLLAGPQRLEAGWWVGGTTDQPLALRDYFIASSPHAGLLWIYRERLQRPALAQDGSDEAAPGTHRMRAELRWFLHGFYA
jgi:protein ImuB